MIPHNFGHLLPHLKKSIWQGQNGETVAIDETWCENYRYKDRVTSFIIKERLSFDLACTISFVRRTSPLSLSLSWQSLGSHHDPFPSWCTPCNSRHQRYLCYHRLCNGLHSFRNYIRHRHEPEQQGGHRNRRSRISRHTFRRAGRLKVQNNHSTQKDESEK